MYSFSELIAAALNEGSSEVFALPGQPVMFKADGLYYKKDVPGIDKLMPADTEDLLAQAYEAAGLSIEKLKAAGDDQFSISLPGISRVRVSAYLQRGSLAFVAKLIPFGTLRAETLGIPEELVKLTLPQEGLVLICGAAESGKSTTLACLVSELSRTRSGHIVTVENPIEYLFRNAAAFISQREVTQDSGSFAETLRNSRRLAPDALMASDVPDAESAGVLLDVAENHRLVLAALTAKSCAAAIRAFLEPFSRETRAEAAARLSQVLQAVICEELVSTEGGVTPVFEVLTCDEHVRGYIRSGKITAIAAHVNDSRDGCTGMNSALEALLTEGRITRDAALYHSHDRDDMQRRFRKLDSLEKKEQKALRSENRKLQKEKGRE